MTAVTGATVAAFLGRGDDQKVVALAGQHAAIVTAMARAYTRDRGFTGDEPGEDVAAVITTATARLVANPQQIPTDQAAGSYSQSLRGSFNGWTLAELAVLNRYRKRAE